MELRDKDDGSRFAVTAYGDGGFRILGQRVEGSIVISGDAWTGLAATSVSELTLPLLQPFLDAYPALELLLIGGGKSLVPVAAALRAALKKQDVAVEPMDTGAAARTYNILLDEGRHVAALLIAV